MPYYRFIQLSPAESFARADQRKRFVDYLARVINAGNDVPYEAHTLNDSDYQWSVDSGNDWWVFFEEGASGLVRIQHRYGSQLALRALCDWLAFRWQATVLPDTQIAA